MASGSSESRRIVSICSVPSGTFDAYHVPFVRDTGLWWQFRRANGYRGSAFTGDPKPDTKRRQRDRSVFESGVIKSVSIDWLPLTRDRLSDAPIGKVEQTKNPLTVSSTLKSQDRFVRLNQGQISGD